MYQSYLKDNYEIIVNTDDGSVYLTARSYSELVGIDRIITLRRIADVKNQVFVKSVSTTNGDKNYRLIPESVFSEWLKIDQPMTYQSLILGDGIRAYLHGLVGYEAGGVAPYV